MRTPWEEAYLRRPRTTEAAFIPKPGEFAIQANGVRSTDADYQKKWYEALIAFAKECNVPYKELTGSVEERVNTIKTTLSKELK